MMVRILAQSNSKVVMEFLRQHGFAATKPPKFDHIEVICSEAPGAIDTLAALERIEKEPKVGPDYVFAIVR